jgi:hypothetical protein
VKEMPAKRTRKVAAKGVIDGQIDVSYA